MANVINLYVSNIISSSLHGLICSCYNIPSRTDEFTQEGTLNLKIIFLQEGSM